MWSLSLVTAPASEPVTAADFTAHARLNADEAAEQSGKITRSLKAAREACEQFTGRQLVSAVWRWTADSWYEPGYYRGCSLYLPKAPVISVDEITYLDTGGTLQTLTLTEITDLFVVELPTGPRAQRGRIFPVYGQVYPALLGRGSAITVKFTAGYTEVPPGLIDGILVRATELYERREEAFTGTIIQDVPNTAERLWWPYVVEF